MTKRLVNLTGHDISIYSALRNGRLLATIPPTGQIARIHVQSTVVDTVEVNGHAITISQPVYHDISGLPDPVDGVLYIVSRSVALAAKRPDVIHVGWRIRDRFDRLLGTNSFFMSPSV